MNFRLLSPTFSNRRIPLLVYSFLVYWIKHMHSVGLHWKKATQCGGYILMPTSPSESKRAVIVLSNLILISLSRMLSTLMK